MINVPLLFFFISVQDFLDKAKKDFEEKWAKNPQVSQFDLIIDLFRFCLLFYISIIKTLLIIHSI